MTDALESELDALFLLPTAEMVAARNALVSRLKKAGEREAAAKVSALKRPAPAAWAINQIYFQERSLLEQALADVAHVRALQATEGLDRQQLAAAVAAQRASLQALVDAALRNLAAAGLPHAGPHERRVFATVQGWLGGSGDEAPGRMTRELEPSGFESLGQLGIPAPLPASGAPAKSPASSQPPAASNTNRPSAAPALANRATSANVVPISSIEPSAPDPEALTRRAREQAEARVFEHKQSFEWAEGRLAEQRKKQAVAEQALDRAKHEVEDAERALASRRAALSDRETEWRRRQEEVEDAERARKAAEAALQQARAELAKL